MTLPLTDGERVRALSCAKGETQFAFVCKMLQQDDVPEPTYGRTGPHGRRYKASFYVSFDALVDRLEAKGFALLVRAVPALRGGGNDRFYSIRRDADARRLGEPMVCALSRPEAGFRAGGIM